MQRIPFTDLRNEFERVLTGVGFSPERARDCAEVFAANSRDGVPSHGLNRFPDFVDLVKRGLVDPAASPTRFDGAGQAIERWDGNAGPGPLNALAAMDRAVALAREHGVGLVGLRNTNHWMRPAIYGEAAARAGMAALCFTNTIPNMPAWGARDGRLGNNPLVIAMPRSPDPIVLDLALSQFSYGRMRNARSLGQTLPVDGGYDQAGKLSRDPETILRAGRPLPIGYWKGSGLSILLDLLATALALGNATHQIGQGLGLETAMCQVFIALDLRRGDAGKDPHAQTIATMVEAIVADVHASVPDETGGPVRLPGERALAAREENLRLGVPVLPRLWEKTQAL